ncbi:MAG: fimbrillin family protein, partial [Bacteroidaceae bacterium]|nr:fimbrillin family protein [Bacteroidaceae bacterium]
MVIGYDWCSNDNLLGAGTVSFTNVDGTEDLLYAATSVAAPTSTTQEMDPVKFQFSHLLSKVKFTFTNGFTTNNADIRVKNIKMTAPKSATIDLAVANWWDGDDWKIDAGQENALTLNFVNADRLNNGQSTECEYERLTIPAGKDQVYKITFDVEVYMGAQLAATFQKTSTVTGVALEMGKAYNFVTEINPSNLNLKEIEFDVEVKEWENGGEVTMDYFKDEEGNYVTCTAKGLKQIADEINNGIEPNRSIILGSDIDLAATRSIASNWTPIGSSEIPFTGTFDGKGYTIKNLALIETEAKEGKAYIGFFGYAEDATIKNVNFENVNINIPCLDIDHSQGH